MRRPGNIVSTETIAWEDRQRGDRCRFRRRSLSQAAGSRMLGCSLYEVPAGKRAWPYHWHGANEEAVYVLEGEGVLRLPDGEHPIAAGDYVALPPGAASAHQVINRSEATLRYLCFSTMADPDVSVYPDSGKVGVFVGAAPGGDAARRSVFAFLKLDAGVEYWEGEE